MKFKQEKTLKTLNDSRESTLSDVLDITFTEVTENTVSAEMPVSVKHLQPVAKILHGGANVVLAETVGSVAGNLMCDADHYVVGVEINANHLRTAVEGDVLTAVASPIHVGSKTQVWDIKIFTQAQKLTCVSRLTLANLKRV